MSTKPKKQSTNPNEDGYYVRNKDLLEELYKWRDQSENPEDRVISEELGFMMYTIAKKLTNHFRFRGYPPEMKQDMISFGCYKAIIGLKNYNFEYTNPFAYLTQIFWNANVSICVKYYKHKNGMKRYIIDTANEVANSTIGASKSTYLNQVQKHLSDFLHDYVDAPSKPASDIESDPITEPLEKKPRKPRKSKAAKPTCQSKTS